MIKEAIEALRTRAEQGDVEASCRLGHLHIAGQVVEQDYTKAFHFLSAIVKEGRPSYSGYLWESDATYHLGRLYEQGFGVEKDYAKAFSLYCSANPSDPVRRLSIIRSMYEHNFGDAREYPGRRAYFNPSTSAADVKALTLLGYIYAQGRGETQQDEFRARDYCFKPAAEQGDAQAQYALAMLMYKMRQAPGWATIEQMFDEIKWLAASVEQGNDEAQNALYTLGVSELFTPPFRLNSTRPVTLLYAKAAFEAIREGNENYIKAQAYLQSVNKLRDVIYQKYRRRGSVPYDPAIIEKVASMYESGEANKRARSADDNESESAALARPRFV